MSREAAGMYPDFPVLGKLPEAQRRTILEDIWSIAPEPARPHAWPWETSLYEFTAHAFGFIPDTQPGQSEPVAINDAGAIAPDVALKGQALKITLNQLRVADYPGGGEHHVLINFYAEHQADGQQTQPLHFTQKYRIQEGQSAAVRGFPVFLGLRAGNAGVSFKVYTVNVKNSRDEKALGFLDSGVFQGGLTLLHGANPALMPLTELAKGVVEMALSRNRNVPVQEFFLGLDFASTPMGARLARGSYVAVQIPDKEVANWDWTRWRFDPIRGLILKEGTKNELIPFNYLVFGVSLFTP